MVVGGVQEGIGVEDASADGSNPNGGSESLGEGWEALKDKRSDGPCY